MALFEERPFAYAVESRVLHDTCSYCLSRSKTLKRCAACKVIRYCNSECQTSGWTSHRAECAALIRIRAQQQDEVTTDDFRMPNEVTRLIARTLHAIKTNNSDRATRTFWDLCTHESKFRTDPEQQRSFNCVLMELRYFIPPGEPPDTELLFRIYCAFSINGCRIFDGLVNSVAYGLYLELSRLDHSCAPSCALVFKGPIAQLRQVRDHPSTSQTQRVQANQLDQYRISYIDVTSTTDERRAKLARQYFFDCHCERCEDAEMNAKMVSFRCVNCDHGIVVAATDSDASDHGVCLQCDRRMDVVRWQECMTTMQQTKPQLDVFRQRCLDTLDFAGLYAEYNELGDRCVSMLSSVNMTLCGLALLLMQTAIQSKRWTDAFEWGKRTLPAYRLYYPKFSPDVAVHLIRVARLYLNVDAANEARDLLIEAEHIVRRVFDHDHTLFRSLRQLQAEADDKLRTAICERFARLARE